MQIREILVNGKTWLFPKFYRELWWFRRSSFSCFVNSKKFDWIKNWDQKNAASYVHLFCSQQFGFRMRIIEKDTLLLPDIVVSVWYWIDFIPCLKVFQGYIDDPRNTDNSWMESQAVNYHDDTGEAFDKFSLKAGDDAKNVRWMDVSHELRLYANHYDLIKEVAKRLDAYW